MGDLEMRDQRMRGRSRGARTALVAAALLLVQAPTAGGNRPAPPVPGSGPGRGFPASGPWLSFYGNAAEMGPLDRVATRFRIINIDADPHVANFTSAQIARLRAGGRNRVLSYLNVGACESFRDFFARAPAGFVSCAANRKAQRGAYEGYPDEIWMDPGDPDHQRLVVEHVARRLAATGIDGFYLDNLEVLEHERCHADCQRAGLAVVGRLRATFPRHLIVMQNATSSRTRLARIAGVAFPSLLDGVAREEVYWPRVDQAVEADLLAWAALGLRPGGRGFFIGTEDYVGACDAAAGATAGRIRALSRARGFSPFVTDASAGQKVICGWAYERQASR